MAGLISTHFGGKTWAIRSEMLNFLGSIVRQAEPKEEQQIS
jgi:hypothetical protein